MNTILPEVIIALTGAFLVITDWVLRMITGDKPRPRADVRGREGTAPYPALSGAVPGYPRGEHPYPQRAGDPAALLAALPEDEAQP